MTDSFILIRFYISLSLLVCCPFYSTYKTAGKISVTNSKSRGNSTTNTPELSTVFTFYKFWLHKNSFNLVPTGPDKYWIIKYSREIMLYYIKVK